jgi:hypothetical protein
MLRGSHRPEAQVLLSLFPPEVGPDKRQGGSIYYPATVGQIRASDPTLVSMIEADLIRLPGYSLGLIVNEPLSIPEDWQPKIGNGATWGASIAHIAPCRWLFAECEREGLAFAGQLALAVDVFGVEPTFSIHTGGTSLNCYYALSEAISPEKFRELQGLVIAVYQYLVPGCSVDQTLVEPNKEMRLAGGFHPRTGQIASIYGATNNEIDAAAVEDRLRALLPPPPAPPQLPPMRPRSPPCSASPGQININPGRRSRGDDPDQPLHNRTRTAPGFNWVRGVGLGCRERCRGRDYQALVLVMTFSPGETDAPAYWHFDWIKISANSCWYVPAATRPSFKGFGHDHFESLW